MSFLDKAYIPIVVVDDLREFPKSRNAVHCKTLDEAMRILDTYRIGQIWLDHDLGRDEATHAPVSIIPLVNAIEEAYIKGTPFSIEEVVIHSSNPVGVHTMWATLSPLYKTTVVNSFMYDLKVPV